MLLYLWMVVQVIAESLPISSSGHVALLQRVYTHYYGVMQFSDVWAFDYVLQGISAVIIFIYFFPRWWQLIIQKPIRLKSLLSLDVWKNKIAPVFLFGLVADSLTCLIWVLKAAQIIDFPLIGGFIITAGLLFSLRYTHTKKDIAMWSCKHAVIIGLAQGIALLPGISRFAMTIATLEWLGYSGHLAFSISFLLQWPLILAGSLAGYVLLTDVFILQTIWTTTFAMATLVAACCGYIVLYGMGKMIDKNSLWKISYYMIIPIVGALLF